MATTVRVPVEVYLRNEYEPDAEYVDGEIEERPMGERDHAAWQGAIFVWFYQNAAKWKIEVYPELRVEVAATCYRVPDVTVLDLAQPDEQIITHAPLAVFEVLSPEDTQRKMMRKLRDYAAMGIPQIWVIDPDDKVWMRFSDGQLLRAEHFLLAENGIDFQMSEISKLANQRKS